MLLLRCRGRGRVGVNARSGSGSGTQRGFVSQPSIAKSEFFSEGNMLLALHLTLSQPSISKGGCLPSLSKSSYAHIVWIVFATLGSITKFATFHWPNLISFCQKCNWRHHFAYIARHHSHQYHRRRHHHRQQHYQFHPHSTQQTDPFPSYAHSPPHPPPGPTNQTPHTHTTQTHVAQSDLSSGNDFMICGWGGVGWMGLNCGRWW